MIHYYCVFGIDRHARKCNIKCELHSCHWSEPTPWHILREEGMAQDHVHWLQSSASEVVYIAPLRAHVDKVCAYFCSPVKFWASQRSLHNTPIFRLLLKVAVNGTHQCDSFNFCGDFGPQPTSTAPRWAGQRAPWKQVRCHQRPPLLALERHQLATISEYTREPHSALGLSPSPDEQTRATLHFPTAPL